jgi:hypothetical protein
VFSFVCVVRTKHHAHFERVGRRLCGHWCTWRSAAMPHLCCVSLSLPDCCAPTAAAWLQPPGGVVGCAPLCVLFFAMFLCVSNRSGGVSHLLRQQFYALWARLLAMMTNAQRRCRTRSTSAHAQPTGVRCLYGTASERCSFLSCHGPDCAARSVWGRPWVKSLLKIHTHAKHRIRIGTWCNAPESMVARGCQRD